MSAAQRLFIAAGIFHPEPGGPATYLHQILPALQARGWSPYVLSFGDPVSGDYPYPVERIPRNILPLRLARYALAARRALQSADIVYVHSLDLPLPGRSNLPRVLKVVGDHAWERSVRRAWIPPQTDIDAFQMGEYGIRVQYQREVRSRAVQSMNAVIVPSLYLKHMVQGWGVEPERIHIVYNSLPALSAQAQTQAEARQRLGLPDGPLLLTAARLTPWKGVDHLITALKALPDLRLIVAGEGSELERLQALASPLGERVRFLGRLARPDLEVYMQAADYLVLYSGYEGLSHTLLESLRLGTPVIASAKGGNFEVVQSGVNGYLVPYVQQEALVETLREAFVPGQRDRLAAQAGKDMERFTFATMVEETDAVLRRYL